MKLDLARKIIDENIGRLLWQCQVQDWDVTVELGSLEDDEDAQSGEEIVMGRTALEPLYHTAEIVIDAEAHTTKKQLLNTLRHELLHIYAAPYSVFSAMAFSLAKGREGELLMLARVDAQEQLVKRLEWLLDFGRKPWTARAKA